MLILGRWAGQGALVAGAVPQRGGPGRTDGAIHSQSLEGSQGATPLSEKTAQAQGWETCSYLPQSWPGALLGPAEN